MCHQGGGGLAQLDALASREDGPEDALLIVTHEDELAVVIGFLDELQQLVGGFFLQFLGEPQDEDLVLGGISAQGHLVYNTVGLADKNLRLSVLVLQEGEPCLIVLDRMLGDKFAPLVDVVVTDAAGTLAVGKREAVVCVHLVEGLMLAAHRAHPAGVAIGVVLAVQVLCRRHSDTQLGNARFAVQQQGMRQAVGVNHAPNLPYRLLVT